MGKNIAKSNVALLQLLCLYDDMGLIPMTFAYVSTHATMDAFWVKPSFTGLFILDVRLVSDLESRVTLQVSAAIQDGNGVQHVLYELPPRGV